MPQFFVLFVFLLIRFSRADPCLTLDPPGPFLVSLKNNSASLTIDAFLCPNSSITVSASPQRITPSFLVQSLSASSDACHTLRTNLTFQSHIGSGKLIFAAATCTISVPIVVAGIVAYRRPSRDPVTSVEAQPIVIPAPRRKAVSVSFAIKTVLPTGETLRSREATNGLEVRLFPPIPSVIASFGAGDKFGNLQIMSTNDGSDAPRPEVVQTVELRNTKSEISAGFLIKHTALVATVRAVKAPARLSPAGGEQITLVVRRGAADQRRLIIGNITIIETEYVQRDDHHISSFISPPLPWGRHKWRMELITKANITVAEDTSGHKFIVAAKPILTSILPAVVRPDIDGFVIISGAFDDSVVLFVDDKRLPSRNIVHRASGEIIMHLPRVNLGFNGTLAVLVRSTRGKKSNTLALKFDPNAVHVDALVVHASKTSLNGRFVIPFVCNRSESPVVFARTETPQNVYEPPSFNFSVRTSALLGMSFDGLSHGSDGMVSLDADLFKEDAELAKDFVTVLVVATQGARSGAALVFISRQVRRDVIGVTILQPFEAQRSASHVVLRAQVSQLAHCRNATNFETQTVWSINKRTIISADSDNTDKVRRGDSATAVEFGRTLVVPHLNSFSYSATVNLTDRVTRKTIATGTSGSTGMLRAPETQLRTFLNGGLTSITLRPEMESYEVHSSVYDGDVLISSGEVEYLWVCKSLSPEASICPEALFPVVMRKGRETTRFNVTTIGVHEGVAVEYFLTIRSGTVQIGNVSLRLTISPAEAAIFPSSRISAGTSIPRVLSDGSIYFWCYHHIVLAILDPSSKDTYNFALFHEEDDTDLLATSADDLLMSHNGYWSPQERGGVLFGVLANKLEAGKYTLFGRRDGSAGPGRGASWMFQIRRCPVLVPYGLPFLSGTAGRTPFFASAASVPPSRNLFFFQLSKQEEANLAPETNPPDSTTHLPECSGGQICQFFVSTPGRYFIRIDMYESSGTHLISSERLETPITVRVPNVTNADSDVADKQSIIHEMTVRVALLQEDKGAFLHGVLNLSPKQSLETSFQKDVTQGLQKLGSSPFLVPIQGSAILSACSHLLLLEQVHHDSERLDEVRRVAETVIVNSVSNDGPATALQDAGVKFYSVLRRESLKLVASLGVGENATNSGDISETSRFSARKHLPLILTAGRECGFSDQLVVKYPSLTRVNVSSGTPMVAKYDDYRIAINCFNGQVRRLQPEPVSVELCSQSESTDRVFATPQILVSVEQDDLTDELPKTELFSGPTIHTSVERLKHVNGSMMMEEDSQSNSACYKTRVSVYVSRDLANDLILSTRGGSKISCEPDGLPVSSMDIMGKNSTSQKSEARIFMIGSDGRISAFLEALPPATARMTVNGTRLRQCIAITRLEGSGNFSTSTVVFSVLGVVGFLLITMMLLFFCVRYYRRRKDILVPDSMAPWEESFERSQSQNTTHTTLGSYQYASGELHHRPHGWEGHYARVQRPITSSARKISGAPADESRQGEERKSTRPVSGSALDGWESFNGVRAPSLLTATDSYTTSSGDLSSFGYSSRMRLKPGMNSTPGSYSKWVSLSKN